MSESEDFDLEAFQAEVLKEIISLEATTTREPTLEENKKRAKPSIRIQPEAFGSLSTAGQETVFSSDYAELPPPTLRKVLQKTIPTLGFLGIISIVAALILLFAGHKWIGAVLLFVAGILFGTAFTNNSRRGNSRRVKAEKEIRSGADEELSRPVSFLTTQIVSPAGEVVSEDVEVDLESDENLSSVEKLVEKLSKLCEAERLLTRKEIMQLICPHLQFVADNAFDISTVVTPILASVAGPMGIPLNTLLFAAIAVVLSKHSVSNICADYVKGEK